jgi:hypothetical protein
MRRASAQAKLLSMMKLLRLHCLHRQSHSQSRSIVIGARLLHILRLIMILVAVAHWIACLWWLVGSSYAPPQELATSEEAQEQARALTLLLQMQQQQQLNAAASGSGAGGSDSSSALPSSLLSFCQDQAISAALPSLTGVSWVYRMGLASEPKHIQYLVRD